MATYKIPQNVEAEDKLIGPFSFKQFIFLIVTAMAIGIAFLLFRVQPILVVIPLPVIIVFGILGLYHREDQPAETYLLAAVNFFIKPRRRIWSNEGLIENVRITAPKRYNKPKTKALGAREHSQLEQLARIIDTHGWAAKRPEITLPSNTNTISADDRLVMPDTSTNQEPLDVYARDDILDSYNNPMAQDFTKLANASASQAKQQAISKMQAAREDTRPDYLATKQPNQNQPKFMPYPDMKQKVVGSSNTQHLSNNNDLTVSQLAKQAGQANK